MDGLNPRTLIQLLVIGMEAPRDQDQLKIFEALTMWESPLKNSPTNSGLPLSKPSEVIDSICPSHGVFSSREIDSPFGEPVRSKCPECMAERQAQEESKQAREQLVLKRRRAMEILAASEIPARYRDKGFEDYSTCENGQKVAHAVCKAYAEKWPVTLAKGGSLVLTGRPGTGKTHLSTSIASFVAKNYLAVVVYGVTHAVLRDIKSTYSRENPRSEQTVVERLRRADLLVLDEVGVQTGSEHERLLMFDLLNDRYQELRPTILVSNLNVMALTKLLGERILDRYRECANVLSFDWDSYRGQRVPHSE